MNRQAALEADEEMLAVGVHGADRASCEALGPPVAPEAPVRRVELVGHVTFQDRADPIRRIVDRVPFRHRSKGTNGAARAMAHRPAVSP